MSLKVIGAGFGRTGTSSMKVALEALGFGKCCHASEVLFDRHNVEKWCDILDGKTPDWDGIFDGYQSTVDWPSSAFYREQMAAYPEAKVILTVRDPESWYRSVKETIYPISFLMAPRWLCLLSKNVRNTRRLVFEVIWDGELKGQFGDKDATISRFNAHIENVKETVPPDRLLVFDVREGWEPLCRFLGVDRIPDEPFPHVNESTELKRIVSRLKWTGRTLYLIGGALVAWTIWMLLT